MFSDLREYIRQAEELDEVKVVEGADWNLEIGAITDLMSRPNTPLLLFDKIKGYDAGFRVVTNHATSSRRVALLLGLPLELKGMDLVRAWRGKTKDGFKRLPPVEVKTGPIKENIHTGHDIDLFRFPVPKWHEADGGRYIGTGDMVIIRDPDEGWVNLGTYRVQVHDKTTAGIYMAPGQHGEVIRRKYWAKGQSCPAVITCGQDPLMWLVATSPVPWGVCEYDYAGWLRHEPVKVVTGDITGLPIPATAEIALEGEIPPPEVESRTEGPFGEWSGYYAGRAKPEPVFKVKSILHRNDPIILGTPPFRTVPLHGRGRYIMLAAALWDELERHVSGVKGVWFLEDATEMLMVVISIEQQYTGQAVQAAVIARGFKGSIMRRFIIVVDDDIDPSNVSEVLWALGTRCDPESDIDILRGCRSSRLDPILSPEKKARGEFRSSVAIINACKPYYWISDFPVPIKTSPELLKKTRRKWGKLLELP